MEDAHERVFAKGPGTGLADFDAPDGPVDQRGIRYSRLVRSPSGRRRRWVTGVELQTQTHSVVPRDGDGNNEVFDSKDETEMTGVGTPKQFVDQLAREGFDALPFQHQTRTSMDPQMCTLPSSPAFSTS